MNGVTAPRVSIVLPTHNRRDTLPRAMASVLAQSFADFELIVVDDGSTEDIESLVTAFQDSRTVYVRRARRGGPAAARNEGIRRARGDLIAFQDSDDEWLVGKLEGQVEALDRHPDADVACTGYFIEVNRAQPRYVKAEPGLLDERAVLTHFHFFPPMWLLRRNALMRAGLFDETLPSREDWELAIRLSGLCRFQPVAEPLVIVHRSAGSVSADLAAHVVSLTRILDRHAARFARLPSALATHLRELGLLQFLFGDPREGRRALLRSARTDPPGLRSLVWWCATAIGPRAARAVHRRMRR